MSIGTGAPGLGKPTPNPGKRARFTVDGVRTWADGKVTPYHDEHIWDGYTARSALKARVATLRNAHRDIEVHDTTSVTVRTDRGEWTETETLTFTDEETP